MRMFSHGFRELSQSWKKGFTTGAQQTKTSTLIYISLWLSGGMTILASLAIIAFSPWDDFLFQLVTASAYLIFAVQCWISFRQIGSYSLLTALFFPIGLLFYQGLFFTAVLEKKIGIKTNWKGRDVR